MQSLIEIKKTLKDMIAMGGQYIPVTLAGVEKIIRSTNPTIGIQTAELRNLKQMIAQYESHRLALLPFVSALKKKLAESPKSEAEIEMLARALKNDEDELRDLFNNVAQIHFGLNEAILEIIARVTEINKDLYLENLFQGDAKKIFAEFALFQKALEQYEVAIADLSFTLNTQEPAHTNEADIKNFAARLAEVERLGDEAFDAQIAYEKIFAQEAWKFVNCKKVKSPLLMTKKATLQPAEIEKTSEKTPMKPEQKDHKERSELLRQPKNGEEYTHENYQWLQNLIDAYKIVFEERYKEKSLKLRIPKAEYDPAPQLIAFIRHVSQNSSCYDLKILRTVRIAINHIGGGLEVIDEAFNDDPKKAYGVFKCTEAIELLDTLQDFIHEKMQKLEDEAGTEHEQMQLRLLERLRVFDDEDEPEDSVIPSLPSP